MFRPDLLASCLALTVFVPFAGAQNRLLVPEEFAQIGAAVQAATPGTVIEVQWQPQPYQPFVIDRNVTIVGSAGEQAAPTVEVAQGVGIDFQLGPGERAAVSRIDVRAAVGATLTQAVWIRGGNVTLEDCRIRGGPDLAGTAGLATLEVADAEVSLSFCRLEGLAGVGSMRAVRSRIAATKVRFFGGTMPAGDGVILVDSTLHAVDSWVLGGEQFLSGAGGVAMQVAGSSRVWLVDSVGGGGMGQPGGIGLVNSTATAVELLRSAFAGGVDIVTGASSAATVGPTALNPNLLGLVWSEPLYRRGTLRPGMSWAVHAVTAPSTPVLMLLSFGPSGTSTTFTRQPAMLLQDIWRITPILADAQGYASVGGTLPNDPNLTGLGLWAQAVAGTAFPLEATPLSGMVVRP